MLTATEFEMTFLLNAVWQPVLIVLATVAATRLLRRVSAYHQYRLWITAIVLSLVMPLAASLWSSKLTLVETRVTPIGAFEIAATDRVSALGAEPLAGVPSAPSRLPIIVPLWLAAGLFAAYLLAIVYRTTDLLRAWVRSRAIARDAGRAELPKSIEDVVEQCSRMLDSRPPDILFSDGVPVPVTIGSRRPVVILPKQFLAESDPEVLLTAVGHEMVHISRRDYAVNLLLEIICLPLSFHPAVVYAKRQLSHTRELCCDETVATRLLKAEAYVRSLLSIADSAINIGRLSPIITVGITDAENLEVRIMSLLKKSELSVNKRIVLVFAAVLLLTIPLAAAAYFAPEVRLDAGVRPEAQPTVVPETEKKEVGLDDEGRAKLERKLVEVRRAIEDPNVSDEKKASLRMLQDKIARELETVPDTAERHVKLERQLEELKAVQNNPNVSAGERKELLDQQEEIELQLKELADVGRDGRSLQPLAGKLEMEKLASRANIPMEQAMKIALDIQPGTIIEKGIGQINDEVIYRVFIRDNPALSDGAVTVVIVSGMDGRIVKTEKTFIKQESPR